MSANNVLRIWTDGRSELFVLLYGIVWVIALILIFTEKRHRL